MDEFDKMQVTMGATSTQRERMLSFIQIGRRPSKISAAPVQESATHGNPQKGAPAGESIEATF